MLVPILTRAGPARQDSKGCDGLQPVSVRAGGLPPSRLPSELRLAVLLQSFAKGDVVRHDHAVHADAVSGAGRLQEARPVAPAFGGVRREAYGELDGHFPSLLVCGRPITTRRPPIAAVGGDRAADPVVLSYAPTSTLLGMITDEWVKDHFDYVSDELAHDLPGTLAKARELCPITHSDAWGGYWVVTKYEDVLRIAQDWETFSSQLGVTIPHNDSTALAIPEHIDPPLHREYKRLINAYFTPTVVAQYEDRTHALVHRLIDDFIEKGECDFQEEFAVPFPAMAFFEFVLNAPSDEVVRLSELSTGASNPTNPDVGRLLEGPHRLDRRLPRAAPDASRREATSSTPSWPPRSKAGPSPTPRCRAIILLLILGGLDTTTGALGSLHDAVLPGAGDPAAAAGQARAGQ